MIKELQVGLKTNNYMYNRMINELCRNQDFVIKKKNICQSANAILSHYTVVSK